MTTITIELHNPAYPEQLKRLVKPPVKLYYQGGILDSVMNKKRLAVVGTRAITPYGKQVIHDLIRQLNGQDIVIVSGLAYGVDAAAHQAALNNGLKTVAILPSPVETPAPAGNQRLARNILEQGGSLVSTYPLGRASSRYDFVQRNEYLAALSDAVLIIEGKVKSGTHRTVDFASDLGIPVAAVPGNITNGASSLPNMLISNYGCKAICSAEDILELLDIKQVRTSITRTGDTPEQQRLLDLIQAGLNDGQSLLNRSQQDISEFNQNMTTLEIAGKVRPLGGNHWGIA